MRIIQLQAENFKRLGAVEINPEGAVVTIGGKNGQGKSSVLDAIFVALKGRAVTPPRPIRTGEEACTIRLDLGELIVTRKFIHKENERYTDSIKVEDSDGRRYGKPQELLNDLLGEIGFDPFEFIKLKAKDQVERLLGMVPLTVDLDEMRLDDQSDFSKRRDVNRDVTRLEGQLAGIQTEEVPTDVPDRDALNDKLANAATINTDLAAEQQRRDTEELRIGDLKKRAEEKRGEIDQLRQRADALQVEAEQMEEEAKRESAALQALDPVGQPVNTDDLREQMRSADVAYQVIERQERRAVVQNELETARKESGALTASMQEREAERNAALAKAPMPVEGLGIEVNEKGDPVLTFEGLPFEQDQISTAAQLRVSVAIGMATNPELRVLRIMDGSLLDDDSMKMLAEMAEAQDFQLWVEVVGDDNVGIIMENGEIRAEPAEQESEGKV